jgi:hypothetical protein
MPSGVITGTDDGVEGSGFVALDDRGAPICAS